MAGTLRDEVAQAIWDVYQQADRDGPHPCDEAAAEALAVITRAVEAVPCDGKDSALGYRYEVLAALAGEQAWPSRPRVDKHPLQERLRWEMTA